MIAHVIHCVCVCVFWATKLICNACLTIFEDRFEKFLSKYVCIDCIKLNSKRFNLFKVSFRAMLDYFEQNLKTFMISILYWNNIYKMLLSSCCSFVLVYSNVFFQPISGTERLSTYPTILRTRAALTG